MSQPSENQPSTWRRLKRRRVYENPWIALDHDDVITPGATRGIYGVVHFRSHAVGVIPLDAQTHTWLVRQSRYTLGTESWEIPEGGAPLGTDPRATARRELEEETGLRARHWTPLLEGLHLSNSVTDELGSVFLAQELNPGEQALEPSEDIVCQRVALEEAVAMALDGRITDALSVAGLLRLALRQETGR